MNYETEFELEAMLCPITRDEHVAAAKAIIAERVKRLHAERIEVASVTNDRLRLLALGGIQAEIDKLLAVEAKITEVELQQYAKPRRGRPPGSKTKSKTQRVEGPDVQTHSDAPEVEDPPTRRANGHAFECLCDDCDAFWNEEIPNE